MNDEFTYQKNLTLKCSTGFFAAPGRSRSLEECPLQTWSRASDLSSSSEKLTGQGQIFSEDSFPWRIHGAAIYGNMM